MENFLMEEVVYKLLQYVIVVAMAYAMAYITGWIAKIKDDRIRLHLNKAVELANQAVLTTNQTFVDNLKKAGAFDKEQATIALGKSIELTKELMTDETKSVITGAVGDFEVYIRSLVEQQVAVAKENKGK